MDNQLTLIIEKLEFMFMNMDYHNFHDDDEIYGGLNFGELKRLLHIVHDVSGEEYDDSKWGYE